MGQFSPDSTVVELSTNNSKIKGSNLATGIFHFRTMFYTSLGRLLMVDLGEDEEKFDAFMIPITQSFESLGQVLLSSGSSKSTYLAENCHERNREKDEQRSRDTEGEIDRYIRRD